MSDGRVVTEFLKGNATAEVARRAHETLEKLGALYKQIKASFGQFSMDTLCASTGALASNTAGDTTYADTETAARSPRGTSATRSPSEIRARALERRVRRPEDRQEAGEGLDQAGEQGYLDQAAALAASVLVARRGPTKKLDKIKHIVVIYEENHSFDNLFGGWEGVNGLDNVHRRARRTRPRSTRPATPTPA